MNKVVLSMIINGLVSIVYYSSISYLLKKSGYCYRGQFLDLLCLALSFYWVLNLIINCLYGITKFRIVGYLSMLCFFMYSPIGLIGVYGIKGEMYLQYKKKVLKSGQYEVL